MTARPALPAPNAFGYRSTCALLAGFYQLCAVLSGRSWVGETRQVLRLSRLLAATARVLVRAEALNGRAALKRAMLACPVWRARVADDFGGAEGLARWERNFAAAQKRVMQRLGRKPHRPLDPPRAFPPNCQMAQDKARRAAHAAKVRRLFKAANAHSLIRYDRVRVDFEGQFRLAPIMRGPRAARAAVKPADANKREVRRASFRSRVKPIAVLPRELVGARRRKPLPRQPHTSPRQAGGNLGMNLGMDKDMDLSAPPPWPRRRHIPP